MRYHDRLGEKEFRFESVDRMECGIGTEPEFPGKVTRCALFLHEIDKTSLVEAHMMIFEKEITFKSKKKNRIINMEIERTRENLKNALRLRNCAFPARI